MTIHRKAVEQYFTMVLFELARKRRSFIRMGQLYSMHGHACFTLLVLKMAINAHLFLTRKGCYGNSEQL